MKPSRLSVTVAWPEQPADAHRKVRIETEQQQQQQQQQQQPQFTTTKSETAKLGPIPSAETKQQPRWLLVNSGPCMLALDWIHQRSDDDIVNVQQGVDSVRELGCLKNDRDVVNLCRHAGGHLPNPAFVAGGAMNPMILHTGVMVSRKAPKPTCSWLPALSDITIESVELPMSLQ
jgi:hypothetical protein